VDSGIVEIAGPGRITGDPDICLQRIECDAHDRVFQQHPSFPQPRASRRMLETLTRPHIAVAAVQAPQPTSVAKIRSARDEFCKSVTIF
jgi:hypothetical protein